MRVTLNETTANLFTKVEQILTSVYLVGGSVRSSLLDQPPSDYDFTTPLAPDEIEAAVRPPPITSFPGRLHGFIGAYVDTGTLPIHFSERGASKHIASGTGFPEEGFGF